MGNQTRINFSLDKFDGFTTEMKAFVTRVGILGGKAARKDDSPMNNAEIGVIHEFGSINANIPARSFLRMPIEEKRRELMKAFGTATARAALENGQYKKLFQLLGIKGEEIVHQAFASAGFGHWPDIKQATKDAKGSSAILIDTAQLERAITSDVVGKGQI